MRSTDVDQVLPIMKRMFLWLSVTKTLTFERSKSLSNILIWWLIAFDEIHNLYDFLDCVEKLLIHPTTQKIMVLSRAITYPMRMLDMVSKLSKVITLIFKRATRGFVHSKSPTPTTDYHYHHCHHYYLYLLLTATTYYYHYFYLLLSTTI